MRQGRWETSHTPLSSLMFLIIFNFLKILVTLKINIINLFYEKVSFFFFACVNKRENEKKTKLYYIFI